MAINKTVVLSNLRTQPNVVKKESVKKEIPVKIKEMPEKESPIAILKRGKNRRRIK